MTQADVLPRLGMARANRVLDAYCCPALWFGHTGAIMGDLTPRGNAERAEEERRGVIRWLRPEFQNPTGAKPSVQADLALPAGAKAKAKPAAKPEFPKSLPDQARAVRAALATRPTPATAAELAKSFNGAKTEPIAELLATLASLGQAHRAGDGRYAA